ncbi:MAG: hypothetical protein EOP45_21650 [Sphingobacteriaceae bacterium]|nr:MAG: hypothetical protein EOP45_21650 [Sphingobacteriaceae bacterium]
MSDLLVQYLECNLSENDDDVDLEIYCIYRELTSDSSGVQHPMEKPEEGAYWCLVSSVVYHWSLNNRVPLSWKLQDLHDAVHNWNNKTNKFGHANLSINQVMEFGVNWAQKINQLTLS